MSTSTVDDLNDGVGGEGMGGDLNDGADEAFQSLSIIESNLDDLEDDDRRLFQGDAKAVSSEDTVVSRIGVVRNHDEDVTLSRPS
jgi:hypothetical protein